ncbi:6-phosphogluconolactonase [Candidatus Oscillochloris fontis]|uniref:6-phosphogluconolactonase n=1 Tax=Candidatus Oscillochloris fontis TaxID=2496868 RepID=UPI00101C52D7|nr:6-phosphogluconolactonase [Candidatus Oscillochloris fontis]
MDAPQTFIFATLDELAEAAAVQITTAIKAAVQERGHCLIALSGGNIPPRVHHIISILPLRTQIPWHALSIIWVDERYVPFDSPDSNYLLARQTLLDHIPIPSDQIYPVPTYYATPELAATVYDRQIQALLATHGGQIDIAILGMGADGHTASLFPNHPALNAAANQHVIAVSNAPKPPPTRISLTPSVLNRSRLVLFLVAGADKAAMLAAALHGPHTPTDIPAQIIHPTNGQVVWMLDTDAAANL